VNQTPAVTRSGTVAGGLVVLIGIAPLLLLEWLQAEGTVGGLRRAWVWGGVAVVLLLCGAMTAWAVRRLEQRAPGHRAETRAVVVAGASAWLVLSLAAPLLVLVRNAGDEVVGVSGAGLSLYAQWALAVLLAAGLAVLTAGAAHHFILRGRQRDAVRRSLRSPA
jgi:hypothetical protein